MNRRDKGDTNEQGNLGLWSVISIIVGIVVGASIFKIPWLIFLNTPDPWSGLLVWVVGGFLAVVGAFCYAELATTYPRSGGDYVYLTRAFGPWCGFLFGWAQLSVLLPAAIGGMAVVFGEFATAVYRIPDFTGLELSSDFVYATSAVVVLSLLNILGVTLGKAAQNILTLAKVIGIVGILVAGFVWAESSPTSWRFADDIDAVPSAWRFLDSTTVGWGALAMILVLYAYGGWNDAAFVAAEVRNPRRNIPLALLLGVGLITFIYLLVNSAYLTGLGFEDARRPPGPDWTPVPARLLGHAFGTYGATAMNVIVMISALGAANGLIFAGARVYATLGNDHPLFTWIGHWRPGQGALILALAVQAIITLGMVFVLGTTQGQHLVNDALGAINSGLNSALTAGGLDMRVDITPTGAWSADDAFTALLTHTAPVFWAFFLATGFSLFVLRTRDANRERPFPVPLYPIVPFIFCNMCVYMLYKSTIYIEWRALFAVVLVLLGLPLYFMSRLIGYHGQDED